MNTPDDYWKFAESERHFNDIQAGIRNLASTWMLAAFAAIAMLLKSEDKGTWLVSPAVLVGIVSFMATMGLIVLWINDQKVYQSLLNSGFLLALKAEYDNKQLPPIRAFMMYSADGKGMGRWMTHFYTIPLWCFLAISIAAVALRHAFGDQSQALTSVQTEAALLLLIAGQLCATLWLQFHKSEGMKDRARIFGDEKFAAMFDGTEVGRVRFANMIERYQPAKEAAGVDKK
jgi:hypothetical protein